MSTLLEDADDIEVLIGGNCPVAGEGAWAGRTVSFRARGSTWSLGVEVQAEEEAQIIGQELPAAQDLPSYAARGKLGNSGWVDRVIAQEIVRLHLWCWDLQEKGLEEERGSQGALFKALRRLDPEAALAALDAGANANKALAAGGPLPLAVALGMFCQDGAEPEDPSGAEASQEDSILAMIKSVTVAHDDGRDVRRLACCKALLDCGADPAGIARGWALAPIHWAAMLPVGAVEEWSAFSRGMPEQAAKAWEEALLFEAARQERNPTAMLMAAGADFLGRFKDAKGDGLSALEIMLSAEGVAAAEILAEPLGEAAMLEVISLRMRKASRGCMDAGSPPKIRKRESRSSDLDALISGFCSGRWPPAWMGKAAEMAGGKVGIVVAALESALIASAASTEGGRAKPSARL